MTLEQIEQKIREWKVLREANRLLVNDPQIDKIIHEKLDNLAHDYELERLKVQNQKIYEI
tara:strand:+ start:386 stop:565 length:180 start_codon:yes stop_codon:yes gene_type:complete